MKPDGDAASGRCAICWKDRLIVKNRCNPGSYLLPLGDFLLIVGVFIPGYRVRHFALADLLDDLLYIPNDFRLDLCYVDNWSIWMDISILVMTIPAILLRRSAY